MSATEEPSPDRPVKVSVIVPTYCPGAGLSRVIDSLDGQSMAQHEFESVFVDDGSPDDTLATLHELARSRPNMRVTSIPNSGWPSRPRNVGLEMARGDFVVFMDHDDQLYPTGLDDAWSYAREHELDALTAKETKSTSPFFAWGAYLEDIAPPAPRKPVLLRPMMIHKMYRRGYLLEHGIRFREGGPHSRKVQWEDIHFNIDVYAHGGRLGVLASRPFYHWVFGTGTNNSDLFEILPEEYWHDMNAVFEHIDAASMDPADADWIRTANYSLRVLPQVGPAVLKRDGEYFERTVELARELAERRVPARIDGELKVVQLARSVLLRGQRSDLLRSLAECDRGVRATPVATDVRMVDGRLHVSCLARWTDASDGPLELRWDSGRLTRVLPAEVAAALPPEALDWSSALEEAQGDLSAGGRHTKVGWPVHSTSETRLVDLADDRVAVETRTSAVFDPRTAAMGRPLDLDQWRIACRSSLGGFESHPVVSYEGPSFVALVAGRVAAVRASDYGHLLLDVKDDPRTALRRTGPDVDAVELTRRGGVPRLVIPVVGISVAGLTRLSVRFRLREIGGEGRTDGVGDLIGDDDGARLELELVRPEELGHGHHRLLVDGPGEGWAGDQGWVTEIVVRVGRGGRFARMSVERQPPSPNRRRELWG